MKKTYVNIIALLVGLPALLLVSMLFLVMRLGDKLIPKSWYIAECDFWRVNNWIDSTGYNITKKI